MASKACAEIRQVTDGFFAQVTLDNYTEYSKWYKSRRGAKQWAQKRVPMMPLLRARTVAYYGENWRAKISYPIPFGHVIEQWESPC